MVYTFYSWWCFYHLLFFTYFILSQYSVYIVTLSVPCTVDIPRLHCVYVCNYIYVPLCMLFYMYRATNVLLYFVLLRQQWLNKDPQSINNPAIVVRHTVKHTHGFSSCFVLVSFSISNDPYDTFAHILQGWLTGIVRIVRLPMCQWNDLERYRYYWLAPTLNKTQHIANVYMFLGVYST